MIKSALLLTCLIAVAGLSAGCETTEKWVEDPFAPITAPIKPIITPINDAAEDVVAVHDVKPAGLDTKISIADKKQIRIAF